MPGHKTPAPLQGYETFIGELKQRIQSAQLRAGLAVNRELVLLYWSIGRDILQRQKREGWGAKVIDRIAFDLSRAFPETTGFSARNLKYMRSFAEAWPDEAIVQALLAQLPWYHHIALIEKIKTPEERVWYARQTIENSWSRNVLVHQIESGLYRRQGRALTNFDRTLPAPESELAKQILKDPYNFDFLSLGPAILDSKQTGQPETWLPFTERLVADRHSFTVIDIAGGRLTLRQIDSNANLIDRIEVTK